ncbi:MAG: ribosome assembly cofactor RimP [Paludibacteraceae bacterium]|nr:ribosome assembly cofactor RimP [Paludibacteraceae bacterium]
MITIEQVKSLVNAFLQDTDYELQTLEIDKDQNILVEIDRPGIVDVDFCAALNRHLTDRLGEEMDDYSLEVGSVSLTDPFKSKIQYQKNLGHNVVVTDNEGRRHSGQLISVDEDTFMIESKETLTFRYDEVKKVIYNLSVSR